MRRNPRGLFEVPTLMGRDQSIAVQHAVGDLRNERRHHDSLGVRGVERTNPAIPTC